MFDWFFVLYISCLVVPFRHRAAHTTTSTLLYIIRFTRYYCTRIIHNNNISTAMSNRSLYIINIIIIIIMTYNADGRDVAQRCALLVKINIMACVYNACTIINLF